MMADANDCGWQVLPGQGPLQVVLILFAFISVPMLLLPKPYILKWRNEAAQHHRLEDEDEQEPAEGSPPRTPNPETSLETPTPKPSTLHPKPSTPNPKSETRNPKPKPPNQPLNPEG